MGKEHLFPGTFRAHTYTCTYAFHTGNRYIPMTVFSKEEERVASALTLTADETLYVVDYTGGWAFVAAACSRAKQVVILDHHKTAAEELAAKSAEVKAMRNLILNIDMERSGATIARDYFALDLSINSTGNTDSCGGNSGGGNSVGGNSGGNSDLGQLFAYIEDNDLWRHALPDTKAFSAGIKDYDFEFNVNINPSIFETLVS